MTLGIWLHPFVSSVFDTSQPGTSPPGAVRPCLNTSLLFFQAWLLAIYCRSLKQLSEKICFEILRVQKNAWSMHLLLTAFWHQHSKFQSAQEGAWAALSMAGGISSQTRPAPWITMQCLINDAGQTSARYLLPNDPTKKSHQSDENLCFRGCWIMQEHSFSSPCPKASPVMG